MVDWVQTKLVSDSQKASHLLSIQEPSFHKVLQSTSETKSSPLQKQWYFIYRHGWLGVQNPPLPSFLLNRPFSFISLLHSNNQSELTTKFYNSSKADIQGNVQTLTLCVLIFDKTESFLMPTDLITFLIHLICLLRKKLQHLAGCCHYYLYYIIYI